VPEYCTCGAQLPPDARFCHKCGRPQREEDRVVEEQPVVAPPLPALAPPQPPPPPQISFRNGIAVRVALATGIPVVLLTGLLAAVAGRLILALPVAGGFFAVYLYRRRTGQKVTVLAGARLGWISGIIIFAILALLLTGAVLMLSQPDFVQNMRDQIAKMPTLSQEEVNRSLDLLRTPSGVAGALLDAFLSYTLLTALGGAVGAKFLDRH
jgi:hypothetical protein